MPERVIFTDKALAPLRWLRAQYGELIFHLPGGCCEGSAPMCLRAADFLVGAQDVLLGVIEGTPFYVSAAHFSYVEYCQLSIDVIEGGGDSFSPEAADGVRFIARSRLFDNTETSQAGSCRTAAARHGSAMTFHPSPVDGAFAMPIP